MHYHKKKLLPRVAGKWKCRNPGTYNRLQSSMEKHLGYGQMSFNRIVFDSLRKFRYILGKCFQNGAEWQGQRTLHKW